MLVSNVSPATIIENAAKLGFTATQAEEAIAEARRRITIAADFNRIEEIGTAYLRLNEIFRRSLSVQDTKTALAAQRELNKLLRLYDGVPGISVDGGNGADPNVELARQHLRSLGIGTEDTGLSELARLAAARICELSARGGNAR